MESWYLLYCKRGQLTRAREHLTRQEIPCVIPMITLEKVVRGKRTQVQEPMFPNYMFIELILSGSIPPRYSQPAALATLSALASYPPSCRLASSSR